MSSRSSRRSPAITALVLAAVLPLAGCGGEDATSSRPAAQAPVSASPPAGDLACREQWAALGSRAAQRAAAGVDVRAAFTSRWEAVTAGIDFYRQGATSSQCGDLLRAQGQAMTALAAVATRALAYDAGQRLVTTTAVRRLYAAGAKPPKESKKVLAAYRTLTLKTPQATKDLAPAMAELAEADPTNKAAVKLGLSDLALLAGTSDAAAACRAAQRTIDAFLAPAPRR